MGVAYIAVAWLVPPPWAARLVAISRGLARDGASWYVLDEREFPPHISLWLAHVPAEEVGSVAAEVEAFALGLKPTGVTVHAPAREPSGYVGMKVQRSRSLLDLHRKLLGRLDGYRHGYIPEKYGEIAPKLPEAQRKSIARYGTRFAGDAYAPHITLGFVRADWEGSLGDWEEKVAFRTTPCELVCFEQKAAGRSVRFLARLMR